MSVYSDRISYPAHFVAVKVKCDIVSLSLSLSRSAKSFCANLDAGQIDAAANERRLTLNEVQVGWVQKVGVYQDHDY